MFAQYLYQYLKIAGTEQIIINKKKKSYLLCHQLSRSVWLEDKGIEIELMHTNEYG